MSNVNKFVQYFTFVGLILAKRVSLPSSAQFWRKKNAAREDWAALHHEYEGMGKALFSGTIHLLRHFVYESHGSERERIHVCRWHDWFCICQPARQPYHGRD